tara:strand:+ start:207 stop:1490 length:1284 start_codon:yes stop_codon:yes gene_type:complete
MREIFNSHPVSVLKKEISKTNIKGYSKMKKAQIVDLMMKNKERFKHIKMAKKPATPAKKPATPPKKAPPKKKKIKFNVLPKTPPKAKTPEKFASDWFEDPEYNQALLEWRQSVRDKYNVNNFYDSEPSVRSIDLIRNEAEKAVVLGFLQSMGLGGKYRSIKPKPNFDRDYPEKIKKLKAKLIKKYARKPKTPSPPKAKTPSPKKEAPKPEVKLSKNVREAPDKTYLYYDKRTKAQVDAETIEGKESGRFTSVQFYRPVRTPDTLLPNTKIRAPNKYEKDLDELIDTYREAIIKYAGEEDPDVYFPDNKSEPSKKEMADMVAELKFFKKKKQEFIRTFDKKKKDIVILEYKKEIRGKKVVYVLNSNVSVEPKYKEIKMSSIDLSELNAKRDRYPSTKIEALTREYSGNYYSQYLFKNKQDLIMTKGQR